MNQNITKEQTIWYPGIYSGRKGDYAHKIAHVTLDELITLVEQRAKEDGEWTIENGLVGDNEDKMRRMMEWVMRSENIEQCVAHIYGNKMEHEYTVDWVCRDLANASKWVGGSRE